MKIRPTRKIITILGLIRKHKTNKSPHYFLIRPAYTNNKKTCTCNKCISNHIPSLMFRRARQLLNFVTKGTLVPVLEGLYFESTFSSLIAFWGTMSWTSRCLVHSWNTRFLHKWIADWLSEKIVIVSLKTNGSLSNPLNHKASLIVSIAAMYSNSMVESATIC